MGTNGLRQKPESGAITVLFCIVSLVLVGSIAFSLYIGQQVERRIRLQNANDLSVQAMADHSAQGLNMIAVNNLSIGAAIHVAGALPILAGYLSALKILTATPDSALVDAVSMGLYLGTMRIVDPGNVFQEDVWNKLAFISGKFMQTASGLSRFNDYLNKYWMIPAPVYSLEMMRANLPDSIALPMQTSNLANPLLMAYKDLKKTRPKDTICHAIKSSQAVPDPERRDDFFAWLEGPIKTLADTSSAPGGLEHVWDTIKQVTQKFMPIKIGFVNCGYGLKTPLFNFIDGFIGKMVENPATALVINGKYNGTLNKILDEIRGHAGTIPVPGMCGWPFPHPCIKRIPIPWCAAQWEGIFSPQAKIAEAWFISSANKDYAKAHMMYEALKMIKGNKNSYYCEERLGDRSIRKMAHVPVPDGHGGERCLDLNTVEPTCAYKSTIDSLPIPTSINCGEISGRFDEWRANDCRGFNEWAATMKFEDHPVHGISVADWGRQADYYGHGGSLFSFLDTSRSGDEKKTQTLSFIIPTGADNEYKDFLASISFVNLAANAVRTNNELTDSKCPKEFLSTAKDGSQRCDIRPLVGLGALPKGISEKERNQIEQNLSAGGLHNLVQSEMVSDSHTIGKLKEDWSRVQWSLAQAKVRFVPTHDDPRSTDPRSWLFWPAWQAQLVHLEIPLFTKMMDLLLPSGDVALNRQFSTLR